MLSYFQLAGCKGSNQRFRKDIIYCKSKKSCKSSLLRIPCTKGKVGLSTFKNKINFKYFMGKNLLFEIGTEELPSSCLIEGIRNIKTLLEEKLTSNRINFNNVISYGTPRRFVAF